MIPLPLALQSVRLDPIQIDVDDKESKSGELSTLCKAPDTLGASVRLVRNGMNSGSDE